MMNPTPRPHPCPKCGQPHERCLAHAIGGGPCGQMPVDGCDVCVNHGARAPAVAAAATARVQRGIARGIAERAVMTYGLSTAIDPFDALKAELDRTNGHVLWLAGVVASLDPEELVWGKTLTEVGSGTGQREGNTAKARSEAAVNIWLKLYKDCLLYTSRCV